MHLSFSVRALMAVGLLSCLPLAGCASASVGDDLGDDQSGEGLAGEAEELTGFSQPSEAQKAEAMAAHPNLDPGHIVPRDLLASAIGFFELNHSRINNDSYVTVIDFSRHSGKKRFFIVDMNSGDVEAHVVAHGSGSDPDNEGTATEFSNDDGSHMSSLGYYLTGSTYNGKHGRSLQLDGLSKTNSAARSRAVVIHGASYVNEGASRQGRSWGCPALDEDVKDEVITKLKGQSLIYAQVAGRNQGGGSDLNTPSSGGATCRSATLGRTVSAGSCVESRSDSEWYKCAGGSWKRTDQGCTEKFPLN
jgi:L,D-transpeptidase catalytic domain